MIRERLQALLAGELPPTVYRLNHRIAVREIEQMARDAGWLFYLLDLRNAPHKAAFMEVAARSLRLPPYFGRNWDAFEEVINDLPWELATRGHLFLLDRTSPLRFVSPDDLRTALNIFETAVAARQPETVPLTVLVRGAGPIARQLPLLG